MLSGTNLMGFSGKDSDSESELVLSLTTGFALRMRGAPLGEHMALAATI